MEFCDGMDLGYIKTWRKSMASPVFANANIWYFWSWCLMRASWKPTTTLIGYQKIDLLPGQFIFGRIKATKDITLSEQTIRTCLKTLEKLGNLTIKSTSKFSIITICNWETYQSEETETNHQINQQVTSNQPASNHIQEVKELKEGNALKDLKENNIVETVKPKRKKSASEISSEAREVLDYLNFVSGKKLREVGKIQERLDDKATVEDCKKVIDFKWNDETFNKIYFDQVTLFRKLNFDRYLNQIIGASKKSPIPQSNPAYKILP